MPAGTPFTAFSINFLSGASRALAALILVEIVMTSGFTPDMMTNAEMACMRSMLYITAVFDGPPFSVQSLVCQAVSIKQAKSQTQRMDVLECLACFQYAVREMRSCSAWDGKPDAEVLQGAILAYNKHCAVKSCMVDGRERMAIQYLAKYGDEVQSIVRKCWSEFKVCDSPITRTTLAKNWLGITPPDGVSPCWEEAMKPTKAKMPVFFQRLFSTFLMKVARAQEAQRGPSLANLRSKKWKEEPTEDLLFSCMCWSHWTPEMQSIMTHSEWDHVNKLFLHGSLDSMITSAIRSNSPDFQAMPGFYCRTHFS